jgi:transposase InsO family protein
VELLKTKGEALASFQKIKLRAEVDYSGRLKALRTDQGGEFNSNAFTVYCNEQGIKHYTTAPYNPILLNKMEW